MNWKHILWIIPMALIIGFVLGVELHQASYDGCVVGMIHQTLQLGACEQASKVCSNYSQDFAICQLVESGKENTRLENVWLNVSRR